MKKKRYTTTMLVIIALFLVSLVSASKLVNTCGIYSQIRPGNQINSQAPHFICCDGDICKEGNGLRKRVNLEDIQNYGADGQADINVYNYNGLDKLNIVLRTNGLPKNQLFTAWILQGDNSRSKLGAFKTNSMGRGHLAFTQTLSGDFNKYHTIVVEWGDPIRYLSARIDFNNTKIFLN